MCVSHNHLYPPNSSLIFLYDVWFGHFVLNQLPLTNRSGCQDELISCVVNSYNMLEVHTDKPFRLLA